MGLFWAPDSQTARLMDGFWLPTPAPGQGWAKSFGTGSLFPVACMRQSVLSVPARGGREGRPRWDLPAPAPRCDLIVISSVFPEKDGWRVCWPPLPSGLNGALCSLVVSGKGSVHAARTPTHTHTLTFAYMNKGNKYIRTRYTEMFEGGGYSLFIFVFPYCLAMPGIAQMINTYFLNECMNNYNCNH